MFAEVMEVFDRADPRDYIGNSLERCAAARDRTMEQLAKYRACAETVLCHPFGLPRTADEAKKATHQRELAHIVQFLESLSASNVQNK